MLRRMGIICLLGVFVFAVVALTNTTNVQAETYNWKMSSPYPPGDDANQKCDVFAKLIEERSNGRIKMTSYFAGLGSPRDAWDMVSNNTVQFTWTGDLYNPGRTPVTSMVGLPFEMPTTKAAYDTLNAFLEAGYLTEFGNNLKPLYFLPSYPLSIYTKDKKISKMEDFKGLKIRCGTGVQGKAFTALGASTVSMPGSEVYMSLQTGVIDGTITGINIAIHRNFQEVLNYTMKEPPFFFGVLMMLVNQKTWDGIPQDLKDMIQKTAKEVADGQIENIISHEQQMWNEFGKKVDCYSVSQQEQKKWRAAVGDIANDYAEELSAKGHPGKEALALMRKIAAK